jgi:hypothetical protein
MNRSPILLPNRHNTEVKLIPVSEDCWKLQSPYCHYVSFGMDPETKMISYFDPAGGPFVEVGEILSDLTVVAIQNYDLATYVYMLDADRLDFVEKTAEICEFVRKGIVSVENRYVIGMIGKAGSGKDTVGDYLKERYGFTGLALADTLKRGVQEMFVIPDEIMYDRVKREEPLPDMPDWTVRKLLQFVGTELIRNHIDDNAWTKSLIKRYPTRGNIVVTDVRFPNEVEGIRELSGCPVYFIQVTRPGYVGINVGIKSHASEIHELEGDFEIVNSTTIEDLYEKVDGIMAEIRNGLDGHC